MTSSYDYCASECYHRRANYPNVTVGIPDDDLINISWHVLKAAESDWTNLKLMKLWTVNNTFVWAVVPRDTRSYKEQTPAVPVF